MNLRVGVQGGANCSTHGALCDGYEGYVGGIRYYNRSLSVADLPEIYHEDRRSGGAPPPRAPPALRPTAAQAQWQEREVGALITWGMSNILSNLSSQGCDWGHRSAQGCKTRCVYI